MEAPLGYESAKKDQTFRLESMQEYLSHQRKPKEEKYH